MRADVAGAAGNENSSFEAHKPIVVAWRFYAKRSGAVRAIDRTVGNRHDLHAGGRSLERSAGGGGAARACAIVDMRHESGVTHAADAWARIHRRPALSLVTGGPGHTNSLTGIATANLAGSPLIAVSGSRARNTGGSRRRSRISIRWAWRGRWRSGPPRPPNAAADSVLSAARVPEANAGRKGAVHLTIPVDVFLARRRRSLPASRERAAARPGTPRRLRARSRCCAAAERPVVIAGSGVWWSARSERCARSSSRRRCRFYTITMARGTVSDEHPLGHGLCGSRR